MLRIAFTYLSIASNAHPPFLLVQFNPQVMMDWLVKLCGLPDKFLCKSPTLTTNSSSNGDSSSSKSPGGVIQGTSSEAVLVAMLAARARALAGQPPEAALKLVAYGTNQVCIYIHTYIRVCVCCFVLHVCCWFEGRLN